MRIRLLTIIFALFIVFPAYAQKTKNALQSEVTSSFPDQTVGAVTPAVMRGVLSDFVSSWQQYVGVNTQVGTSYTFQNSDYGQVVTFNNAGSMTGTLPTPASPFLPFNTYVINNGAGTLTLSATAGTINSASTLVIGVGSKFWILADGSQTNYIAIELSTLPNSSLLTGNNTWSGTQLWTNTNIWSGKTFFGSGSPWVDVKSGANGCAAAVGNNTTDDTAAIQCQITFINGLFGGGEVFLPCATYKVTSTITVPGGVMLVGGGRNCAIINGGNNDLELLNFTGGSNTFGGLRDLTIFGDQTAGSLTNNVIVVNAGTPVRFSDCTIWGGNFALQEDGTDGSISDCFIMGVGTSGGGITSSGANWYRRIKLDTIGSAVLTAYKQNTSAIIQENHFDMSDFSGSFTDSVIIADADNNAITSFTNSVFSSAISITGAQATMFGAGVEFGVAVASAAPVNIVGAIGLSAITMTGVGARSCAGNFHITC